MLHESASIGIIGGADGPTAIFVTSTHHWFSLTGLILVLLILAPNIVYAIKHPHSENRCTSRLMNILEQIGRYGCILLTVFDFGFLEFGYSLLSIVISCLLGSAALLLAYWICWIPFFRKPGKRLALALAVLPACIFLLHGIARQDIPLIAAAILFGIAHSYVTSNNYSCKE